MTGVSSNRNFQSFLGDLVASGWGVIYRMHGENDLLISGFCELFARMISITIGSYGSVLSMAVYNTDKKLK